MKFRLLIIILFVSTNLIKIVNSVGERGQGPKLYKTFDEIFGKGWDNESNDSKDCRHVKEEEVQDGQSPKTSDQKNIEAEILKQKFDEIYDANWSEDENNSAPDQDESVNEQQNESNKCEQIESDQQKWEIIQKFREMKEDYTKNRKYSRNEHVQIEIKISKNLGVGRTTIYKWIKELGLRKETKSKFSDLEKHKILKQFDEIKSKCKKAKFKNSVKNELDEKIAKKLGVCARTVRKWKREFGFSFRNKKFYELEKLKILKQFDQIKSKCKKAKLKIFSKNELDGKISKKLGVCAKTIYEWKRKFGLSVSNKFSDATKIGILKEYAKIKGTNLKMRDCEIADILTISSRSLSNWKKQFKDEIKNL